MRAISIFSFEAGTSSFCWRALTALRMRVNKSATGSVKLILISSYRFAFVRRGGNQSETYCRERSAIGAQRSAKNHSRARPAERRAPNALPGRFGDAWNFAAKSQSAEAQAAYAELAQVRSWTSAQLAAVVPARGKLGRCRFAAARLLKLFLDLRVLNSFCCSHAILKKLSKPES